MKEKTFNSLMKKTKKELIEIIFRKDDVHVNLNEKITSLEKDVSKQIELRKIVEKDMNKLSEDYSNKVNELTDEVNELTETHNDLKECYDVILKKYSKYLDENNDLLTKQASLLRIIKTNKNQVRFLITIGILEFVMIVLLYCIIHYL